jgi:hypothetical protein
LDFHEMFPVYDDFHSLGQGKLRRKQAKRDSVALKALSVLPAEGAPKWLKELT